MMKNTGHFITIEGTEGMGKSTAMHCIEQFLVNNQFDYLMTREPGGTEIAEEIRKIILQHYNETMNSETELLLYFAARLQHVSALIKPALAQGKIVVSDRFTDASYAYQGGGRQLSIKHIELLEEHFVGGLQPDMTILLDAPVEIGLTRIQARGEPDRMESERQDFYERVRSAYHQRAQAHPERFVIIDATAMVSEVEAKVQSALEARLSK